MALCCVLDLLSCKRPIEVDKLEAAINTHLALRLNAYGPAAVQPKCHYALHLPQQLRQHQQLIACWTHERKHKELKRWANQVTNANNAISFEQGLLEDVVLHQVLALEEWQSREGIFLKNGRPASDDIASYCIALGRGKPMEASPRASYDASVRGESISKGDVVLYEPIPNRALSVAQVWFHLEVGPHLLTCLSPWQAKGANIFEMHDEPCIVPLETIVETKAWKKLDGQKVKLVA